MKLPGVPDTCSGPPLQCLGPETLWNSCQPLLRAVCHFAPNQQGQLTLLADCPHSSWSVQTLSFTTFQITLLWPTHLAHVCERRVGWKTKSLTNQSSDLHLFGSQFLIRKNGVNVTKLAERLLGLENTCAPTSFSA